MSIRVGEREAAQFRREGYFVVPSAMDPELLEGVRRAADRAVEEERALLQAGGPRFVPVSALDDRYVVSGWAERDRFVQRLVTSELMADICRITLGDDAFLFSDTFVCKAPNNVSGWIWHQDSGYLDHVGCGHYGPNLSVWVALDDMTAENGAIRVIPFSTLDVRRVVRHDLDKDWSSQEVVDFGVHENLLLEVPAGTLVVFDGALPHASDPNRTARPRRAYLVQYSREPIMKDGKLLQCAIPLLKSGQRQEPPALKVPT